MPLQFPQIQRPEPRPSMLDQYLHRRETKKREKQIAFENELARSQEDRMVQDQQWQMEDRRSSTQAAQREQELARVKDFANRVAPHVEAAINGDQEAFQAVLGITAQLNPEADLSQITPDALPELQNIVLAYADMPKEEDFTLSSGATRYDADGNVIADNPVESKPAKGSYKNALLPNGDRQGAIELEDGTLVDPVTRKPLPPGTTVIGQTIQTDSVGGLTESQAGARLSDAMTSYEGSEKINESISSVLPKIIGSPGAAGTTGRLASFAGNVATILMNEEAGNTVSELFSGMDQEELSRIETEMKLLRAKLRPLVTGDSGSRQSESERRLAGEAIGFIEEIKSTADLAQAYPKVIGSLKQLAVESYVNQYQQAKNNEGVEYPFDLTTDQGMEDFALSLFEAGLDEKTIEEAMNRSLKIQTGRK